MSTESPATAEKDWPVNRVFLPEGVIGLAAVSPELENGEGDWWIREPASIDAAVKYVDPCPFCNHSQGHNNASHCLRCDRALPITASVGAGEDTAWPLRDVLDTLIKWADHLRNSHDCDHEGYEVLLAAIDAAQSYRSVGADTGAPLQNLGLEIREINAANGWAVTQAEEFADKYKFPAVLMLIVSEVAEALEAFRESDVEHFKEEMADVLIRILDCVVAVDPDFDATVRAKLQVNRGRGYHHGGKKRI